MPSWRWAGPASSPSCTRKTRPWSTHTAICLAAVEFDVVARRVINRVAEYLADCAVIIANALDLELFVIGGRSHSSRGRDLPGQDERVPAVPGPWPAKPHGAGSDLGHGREAPRWVPPHSCSTPPTLRTRPT